MSCCWVVHCKFDLQELAAEVHDLLQGNSLYLVGMMGSGKSTVGRLMGKALKYPLLDTDALIEQSSKASVSEIFAEEGEDAFRDMETEVLHVSGCFFIHYFYLEIPCKLQSGPGQVYTIAIKSLK